MDPSTAFAVLFAVPWLLQLGVSGVPQLQDATGGGGGCSNVDIGRGVDVLQRFGIVSDVLFGGGGGDASSNAAAVTNHLMDGADRFTEVLNVTKHHSNSLNVTFCPDVECLFRVYYEGFQVDEADEPWKLLTASRSPLLVSERFGISDLALGYGRKYVIMTFRRPVKRIKAFNNFTQLAELKPNVAEKLKCMSVGVESMVTDFILEHGSHYIDEYTVGDTVFQVLAYLPVFYDKFYDKCAVNGCSELVAVSFMSPRFTEHQGKVLSFGSGGTVEKWVDSTLEVRDSALQNEPYVSLYALKNRPELRDEMVELMDGAAVIGLHLKSMSAFLPDPVKRKWFTEVLNNHVQLRAINL